MNDRWLFILIFNGFALFLNVISFVLGIFDPSIWILMSVFGLICSSIGFRIAYRFTFATLED